MMTNIGKTYLLVDTANTDCLTDCLTINEHDSDTPGDTSGATGGPSPEALAFMRAADAAVEAEGADNLAGVAGRRGSAMGHTFSSRAAGHDKSGKEDADGKPWSAHEKTTSADGPTATFTDSPTDSLTDAVVEVSLGAGESSFLGTATSPGTALTQAILLPSLLP